MKIAIVGPGAIGSLFAAYLYQGGLDVTLLDRQPERAKQRNQDGIRVIGIRGELLVMVPSTTDSSRVGPMDVILVCVKSHQTQKALEQHRLLVGSQTVVWSIQNGIGNVEAIEAAVPRSTIVGGCTTLGASLQDDQSVLHAGEGDTFIGELQGGSSKRVEQIAKTCSKAGILVTVSCDIQREIWGKLLVSVGINALTSLLEVPNGTILQQPGAIKIMEQAVLEAIAAAARQGIAFDPVQEIARVRQVAERTASNRSSMLMDLLQGRATEIEAINGAVAQEGSAPVNETLANLVRAKQRILSS